MGRTKALVLAVVLALGACGRLDGARPAGGPSPTVGGPADTRTQAEIYAAVIRQLVTKDHTFGSAPSPFKHVYVVNGAIPGAGQVRNGLEQAPVPFPEELKRAITDLLGDLPPLEFITDPNSVRLGKQGLDGVMNEGVIISLDAIQRVDDEVHVPSGLWCGGLCGQWLTYVLAEHEDDWAITGTTGPYAIA